MLKRQRIFFAICCAFLITACGGGATEEPNGNNPPPNPPGNPSEPVISFNANPMTVSPGGATTLTWSVTNADSCSATGDWSGTKQINSSEVINNITTSTTYTLTCTGAGGSDSRSVSILLASSSDTVSGKVDSSYIDREGLNSIYVFSGNVTPDDYDGDGGDPIMVVPVTQIENSCSWQYSIASLAPGDYTIAFTNEAQNDNPSTNDAIVFSSVVNIIKTSSSITEDIVAKNILRVGPGRAYATPGEANAAASDGDVIEIDAGTYIDDIVVWRRNNLTIRAVGGRAHIQATKTIPYSSGNDSQNGKGIWVAYGRNLKVENIEFSGAKVPDQNGAGLRADNIDLTVCNCYFHENENGILGGGGNVLIEFSEFNYNGYLGTADYGKTHNMYISGEKFTLRHSYVHHADIGHNVKTRAKTNYILYNRIMDEASGTSSYDIDVPNGGLTYIIGNLIQQGPGTDNSTIISYGAEGLLSGRTHNLYVVNNTLVNENGNGTFIYIRSGTSSAKVINNIFTGNGNVVSGTADLVTNLVTNSPGLQSLSSYNYELATGSDAIDAGTMPGSGDGYDLTPKYEYVHNSQRRERVLNGDTIDIGAYEY